MATPKGSSQEDNRSVVLFDGVCNLCNGAVNFIIDRDPDGRFAFAPLQSAPAHSLLAAHDLPADALDSLVLIEGGRAYVRSEAALRIARRLKGGWPLFYGFTIVPRFVRDQVYDWVAAHRYRWFGKQGACRLPTPELRARFLEMG
ncbi:MAG TPA: thiol-disulfide oxidoreductase DCC family protein [Rhodothermales bacterium]|nr:thiol-disulfide oxidoreductase DCC family protein [Rhodothermales bacterium]